MESKLITYNDGHREWVNEKNFCHRLDGPAVMYLNGDKDWRIDGWTHRLNGPAFVRGAHKLKWHIRLSISYNPVMDNA